MLSLAFLRCYKNCRFLPCISLALASLWTVPVSAEILVLKSGQRLNCEVVEESPDNVTVNVKGIILSYPRDEIAEIQPDSNPQPQLVSEEQKHPSGTKPALSPATKSQDEFHAFDSPEERLKMIEELDLPEETKQGMLDSLQEATTMPPQLPQRKLDPGPTYMFSSVANPMDPRTNNPKPVAEPGDYPTTILETMRDLASRFENYKSQNGHYPEPADGPDGQELPLVDEKYFTDIKQKPGYAPCRFSYRRTDGLQFQLTVTPDDPQQKTFFVDETGIFRENNAEGKAIETFK